MKRLKLALAGAAASLAVETPAIAQQTDPHAGHTMPPAPTPTPAPTPAPAPAPAESEDPHAGHTMPSESAPAPVQTQPVDPHAGHTMPSSPQQPDPMAGHDMSTMPEMVAPAGTDLPAGNAPPPPVPTVPAADLVYGDEAMEMGRHHLFDFHGGQKLFQVLVNTAEYQFRDGRDGFQWDAQAWYGGDISRVWLKTEGEGAFGEPLESAEVQALYSHAIGPYFNVQGGLRYDFKPDPSRVYAAIGLEGLAPSFFDVEGTLFLSNKGELMARAEGWYDQRITQRLILQPGAELNFAAQNSRDIGVGAGLTDAEVGVRLRYDIRREFAPYIGVQYNRAFGRTRSYRKGEGEDADGWSLLTGIRLWF